MQIVQLGKDPILFADAHGVVLPGLVTMTVNAIRVWTDRKGKTHFDFALASPTRELQTRSHRGTMLVPQGRFAVRGQKKPVPYTWSRSALFHMCCGDCGAELAA